MTAPDATPAGLRPPAGHEAAPAHLLLFPGNALEPVIWDRANEIWLPFGASSWSEQPHSRHGISYVAPLYPRATPAEPAWHEDDDVVDAFAAVMKAKLRHVREVKGRGGWQSCSAADLSTMLREHVGKGDPVDVANFAMMLWGIGAGIATPAEPVRDAREVLAEAMAPGTPHWKPEARLKHADAYLAAFTAAGLAVVPAGEMERLREALEAVDAEILLDGQIKEIVDAALAPQTGSAGS